MFADLPPPLCSLPGNAVFQEPQGSSAADTPRCSLCGEVKSSAEVDGSRSGPSGRIERALNMFLPSWAGPDLGDAVSSTRTEQRSDIPEGCPHEGGPPLPVSRKRRGGWLAHRAGCICPCPHAVSLCPSFPYREKHPQENCAFNPQPQAEEQALGLASADGPWTLVPGCCPASPSPTSFGLHLLSSRYTLSTTHCVSLPLPLPHAT